ncbi:MAG: hypothetical protein WD604_09130 [Balneolaceae bacterium]
MFYACSSDSTIPEELQPYSRFEGIQESMPIAQRVNLIPEDFLNSTNFVDSLQLAQHERGFDVVSIADGAHLFYLRDSDQLYTINREGNASLIASSGNDPHSIQEGICLRVMDENVYVVQRARISKVVCDPECALNVLNIYDHGDSGFINSIYPISSGDFVVNGYDRNGKHTLHIVNEDFEILESKGEYFQHSNPALVANYNLAYLSANRSGDFFAHVYGSFPFIALYNVSLDLKRVYRVHDFFDHWIATGLDPFATGYEKNHMVPASTLVTVNPLGESAFWVIVAHQRHINRQAGFGPVEIAHFFDFYILEEEQGLSYVGSLHDYAVPQGESLYVLKDQMVYRVDVSLEQLPEFQHEVFDLPEGFDE